MNQEKIGRFIASCRKEQGLTQAVLAEKHLLEMRKQEELANKKLLSLETVIGYSSSISFLLMIFAASFAVTITWWRIALSAAGFILFIVGIVTCMKLEHDAGYYECPECGTAYVPSMGAVVFAPHIGRNRKMTCPHCGRCAYHKKVLTKPHARWRGRHYV